LEALLIIEEAPNGKHTSYFFNSYEFELLSVFSINFAILWSVFKSETLRFINATAFSLVVSFSSYVLVFEKYFACPIPSSPLSVVLATYL